MLRASRLPTIISSISEAKEYPLSFLQRKPDRELSESEGGQRVGRHQKWKSLRGVLDGLGGNSRANSSGYDTPLVLPWQPLNIGPATTRFVDTLCFCLLQVQPGGGRRIDKCGCPLFHSLPRRMRQPPRPRPLPLPPRPPPRRCRHFERAYSSSGVAGAVCGARVFAKIVVRKALMSADIGKNRKAALDDCLVAHYTHYTTHVSTRKND